MEQNEHLRRASSGKKDIVHAHVPARRKDLVRARSVRGFRFTESLHKGYITPHSHERATVTALLHGYFEECYSSSSVICETDSVLLRPAGILHADKIGQVGAHNFVLEVDNNASLQDYAGKLEEVIHLRDLRLMNLIQKMRGELHINDDASQLSLEGLALEFFASILRLHKKSHKQIPGWLRRGQTMIRDRFKDEGLQIQDIAGEVGVHPVHFIRAFKLHFGHTPGRYLRKIRIEWAADQVRHTSRPLSAIALEAGFADQSHFGRAFKKYMGHTPKRWREGH